MAIINVTFILASLFINFSIHNLSLCYISIQSAQELGFPPIAYSFPMKHACHSVGICKRGGEEALAPQHI